MNGIILLIVALGALGAFSAGVVLLFLYFRAGRGQAGEEPVVYGNLMQCPHCGYMNPIDSAACLNCRQALPRPQRSHELPPPTTAYSPDYAPYRPPSPPMATSQYAPPPAPPLRPTPLPRSYAPNLTTASGVDLTAPSSSLPAQKIPPAEPFPQATVPATLSAPAPVPPQATVPADRAADLPKAWLEGTGGIMTGHNADIEKSDVTVGRSTSCDIQVYDPKVSRRHFMIRYANGAFFLQDQQSSRGTMINGERVMAQRLHDGDRIELGDTILIFHLE